MSTKPPITPPTIKFSANMAIPPPKDRPPGISHTHIRCRPKGRPQSIHSHTYSGYIAAMSMRTSYDKDGNPHTRVDEDLRWRLERKLIITILDFDLN